jgi:hypothetical protein
VGFISGEKAFTPAFALRERENPENRNLGR